MPDIELHLPGLEESLLQPGIRRSPEALSRLLAEEFREFGSSGRIFNKAEILESLKSEATAQFSISDFEVAVLAADIALVTYVATRRNDPDPPSTSLRSSLWVLRQGNWHLFHQGTKVPAK